MYTTSEMILYQFISDTLPAIPAPPIMSVMLLVGLGGKCIFSYLLGRVSGWGFFSLEIKSFLFQGYTKAVILESVLSWMPSHK